MKKGNKTTLISSIVFFIIGLLIFIYADSIIKTASYAIGGLLMFIGIYKTFNYVIQDKRLGVVNTNEFAFGVTAIVLGIIFIFLASAFDLLFRFIIGGYLVFVGISKIFQTFFIRERNNKFYALIVVGIILILIGLYIMFVSNLAISIIGLFMMLYGLIDFISYFVYKDGLVVKEKESKNDILEAEIVDEKNNEEE